MTCHPNQTTAYHSGLALAERDISSNCYHVEKHMLDRGWVLMSAGDADREAPEGRELDRLIRRARVLEGRVRITRVRRGVEVVVWESGAKP